MSATKTNYLANSFSIAAVWFATHCGGGFATGNQELNFFSKYGYTAFFLPFIAMCLVAWAYRNGLAIAKIAGAYNYKAFANALYHPYEKVFSIAFEVCMLANCLVAISTSIAGAGALLDSALGFPYFIAIVAVGAVLLCLTIFGGEVVLKALNYKTYFMIVTLIVVCFLGVNAGLGRALEVFTTREAFGTDSWEAVWRMCLYVGFQSFGMVPAICVSQRITSFKECNYFGFFGVALNGGFLTIVCIMVLGFTPGILNQTLPVYYVTTHLGFSWLLVLYSLILFVALIGTAVAFIFVLVARFENAWSGPGAFKVLRVRRATIAITTMVICVAASTLGLTALVVKGYGSIGYVGLVFVIFPVLVIGTIKIRNAKKLSPQLA